MISITDITESGQTVFRIDGRLTADDVPVLDESCSGIGKPHVLDLSKLQSVDAAGSEKLRELASDGVEIRGMSPYLKLLLEDNDKG